MTDNDVEHERKKVKLNETNETNETNLITEGQLVSSANKHIKIDILYSTDYINCVYDISWI